MKKHFKRFMVSMMVGFVLISMIGCGSSGGSNFDNSAKEETTEAEEPLDLTGLWIQKDADEDNYITASIRDDGKIGVFFKLEGDDKPWTYWVGTYVAPSEATDKYSWTSDNTYDGNGLLASDNATKDFTYDDGIISFPMTFQGKSGTIHLIRGEWDTSQIPESVFTAEKVDISSFKSMELQDSGWIVSDDYLSYYVNIYNPNEDIAVEYPKFRITARDASGVVIGTEDQTLSILYPQQNFIYGSLGFSVDEMPTTVDFEIIDPDDNDLKSLGGLNSYEPLEVVNTAVREDKIVGEINNPNDYDIDDVALVILCKNSKGELVNIASTFVEDCKAGTTTPFSESVYAEDEIAEVEAYANQW